MLMVRVLTMLIISMMGIPIERCTAFVLDPKVGEGENAVAALNDDYSGDAKQSQYHKH